MFSVHPLRCALAAVLICCAGGSAHALQLGETKAQLLARHGAPGAEDRARNLAMYFWEGWSAQLEFQGDAVRKLTYRRNWYLGDSEIASLLQSNGGAAHWREVTVPGAKTRQWLRADGAMATCLVERALSMTFQTGRPPAVAAAPKVVVPATPPVVSSTPPTFPKLLGSAPEPELPESEPPPQQGAELKPAARPLPRLPVEEIQPATRPSAEADPPKSTTLPTVENTESPTPPEQAPATGGRGTGVLIFVVLAILGAGAGAAVFLTKRHARRKAAPGVRHAAPAHEETKPAGDSAVPAFDGLRLDQFEVLVGEIFRRQGCIVELSAGMGQDDGIDLMLRRDSETILVQCKDWKTARVAEREVREFYGAMASTGAPRGIFVTTGSFTREAREFAEGKGIELMDGAALVASAAEVTRPGENLLELPGWIEEFAAHARIFDPECPVCQGAMVIRSNRTTGAQSWTCRSYPRCPGKREPRLDLLAATAGH